MRYILLLLIVSCLFVGCSDKPTVSVKQDTEKLVLSLGGDPSNFNPILSTDAASSQVESLVFNGLLKINDDLELVPDLATSYTVLDKGLRYRFFLHQKATWHDGHPLTAEDVKFTFETVLDKKTNTVRRSNFVINGHPMRFEVVDAHTIDVILPEPFSPALIRLAMSIIPKHLLENQDINTTEFNRNPIGTGPFKFVSYKPAQFVHLQRNDTYFGQAPKLKEVLFKIIPNTDTAVLSLEKGEIDSGGIPPKEVEQFSSVPSIGLYQFTPLSYTYMAFNLKQPLFNDRLVRQAIAHAIDKNALLEGVLKGHGKVAHIPSSPVLWSYPKTQSFPIYNYNPKQSEQLLEQAGFTKNESGIYQKGDQELAFTLITNKGNKEREKTAQVIQQFLKQVGIKMSIQVMEWSSFLKVVNAPKSPKPFDAVILGWSLSIDPDSYSIWHSSQYPKGFNFIGFDSPKVDQLLMQGRRELSQGVRASIYSQLYSEIATDVPYIFLFFPKATVGVHRYVKGLSKPGPAGLFNVMENIYIENE